MIRKKLTYSQAIFVYTALLKICDAITVIGMWYLVWYLRFMSDVFPIWKERPLLQSYSEVVMPLALVFSAVFHLIGTYRRDRIQLGFKPLRKILSGSIVGTLVFIAICYFLRLPDFSRLFLALFPFVAACGLIVERIVLHAVWKFLEPKIISSIHQLVIGTGELLETYIMRITEKRPYPVKWVGRLGQPREEGILGEMKYLGDETCLPSILSARQIDTVLVSYPPDQAHKYSPILSEFVDELVSVKVIPDFGKVNTFAYRTEQEWGIPLLQFNQIPTGTSDLFLKRLLDIVGAVAIGILLSPIYILIALLIKLTSRGPVFYSQVRMGVDGKTFTLYKFRSMAVGAESQTGPVWARKDDGRTTAVGKWLRRYSLDEIPQFYNVLKGDMSLVGPRPERPIFVEKFRDEIPKYMLRHKMKSGITGWAQVNGLRGNTSLDDRIRFDLFYIGHWSHLLDFKILCLTALRVLSHRHAY